MFADLPPKGAGELLHADFAVGRHDDADRLAVHLRHQRLQHPVRLLAQRFGRLQADALGSRIVVIGMNGEGDARLGQHLRGAGGLGHRFSPYLTLNAPA